MGFIGLPGPAAEAFLRRAGKLILQTPFGLPVKITMGLSV
jgi:hypothetical protein